MTAPLSPDARLAATAAELLPDPVVWLDATFRPVWANAAAEEIFGWDRATLIGELDLLALIHPDDINEALVATTTVASKEIGTLLELRIADAHGAWHRTEIRGRSLGTEDGGLLLVIRDLKDRHGWDVAGGNHDLLRTVLEASSTPVLVCDPDGVVRASSAALSRILGWDREQVRGMHLCEIADEPGRAAVHAVLADSETRRRVADISLLDSGGERRPFRLEISDLRDDPVVGGFVVFAHDIADLHTALTDLERHASRDTLTGLANRDALLVDLRRRLGKAEETTAVLFCDLDGFKAVNDLLGHNRGDELLCEVADRLRAALRPTDMVARLGGDEFVVVSGSHDAATLEALADRVERAVCGTRLVGSREPLVMASVGAVLVDTSSTATAEEVLAEADSEMYRAKSWRRGLEALPATVSDRRRLAIELARGFERGEVEAHFQPIVTLPLGEVHGFETLVRWRHPERGLLAPGAFLAVCEEAGLEGSLAAVTIQGAAELLARTPERIGVSVNLSPLQLADPSITDALLEALAVTGVSPHRLAVEVTEQSVLDRPTRDGRRVPEVLADMRASGIRIAVDDFGTGTASLARLVEMPASILKVDRSFVAGLGTDRIAAALIRAVISLASDLGMAVVAEGVETAEQASELTLMGCGFAQGWRYAKALPLDEALEFGLTYSQQ